MSEAGVRTARFGTGPVLVLASAAVLAGCGEDSTAGLDQVEGRTFVSTAVVGHTLAPDTEVQVIFQSDRISVRAGCNTLSGGVSWDGDVLVTDVPMAQTLMACDGDLSRQDAWLAAFFATERPMRLDGSTLVLGDSTEGMTLDEQ